MMNATLTLATVKEYYGKKLSHNGDLKTSACCSADSMPREHRGILDMIDEEILNRFYGCGSPLPPNLRDCVILDLGCGTGRDTYLASYLAGENGYVIGVDMTDEQIRVAKKHIDSQTEIFGFSKPNVDFRKGYIEDLKSLGIEDSSIDVVISNCVINLSPDKPKVFEEIFRVLKPGGELYFSDVFTGRRVPPELQTNSLLYGECLAGALYIEDFRRMLANLACRDYRIMSKNVITLDNEELERVAGMIDFCSITVRAFKLDDLEDRCEDYGQVAIYRGTSPGSPHHFVFDDHHVFVAGKPKLVCGNTASMLQNTRYGVHFNIIGNRDTHYGIFDCRSEENLQHNDKTPMGGSCC